VPEFARRRPGRSGQAPRDTHRAIPLAQRRRLPIRHPTRPTAMTYAIEPRAAARRRQAGAGHSTTDGEDLLIRFFRTRRPTSSLIAGAGQPHNRGHRQPASRALHAEVTLKSPKVPYLETIRIRARPRPPQEAVRRSRPIRRLQIRNGAHAPRRRLRVRLRSLRRRHSAHFIPAIEKGIVEAAVRGYLAGYPVVDSRPSSTTAATTT